MYLSAASFGKTLTDEVDSEKFAHTTRVIRVLNQVRSDPGLMISFDQFRLIGYDGLINRLVDRSLFKLAWKVMEHLQLHHRRPKMKSDLISSWARDLVRNSADDVSNDVITSRIGNRIDKLKCQVSFIEIATEAAELGRTGLAFALANFEPRFRPKVELLLKIDRSGEKALECALESHDPDLIYLALLHIHSKCSSDEYREILRKYPQAAAQYAIYCRQHNRKMLEELDDPQVRTFHLGKTLLLQAAGNRNAEEKIPTLENAAKTFKMTANSDFIVSAVTGHKSLLEKQQSLEEQYSDMTWTGLSVKNTVENVLLRGDVKLATQIKKEFRLNEKLFYRLRLTSLARLNKFDDLEQFVKAKKPPFPFSDIVKICTDFGRNDQAEKFLPRCQGKAKGMRLNLISFLN